MDFFYCLRLLETTGVTVVPGSGFGQARGAPTRFSGDGDAPRKASASRALWLQALCG